MSDMDDSTLAAKTEALEIGMRGIGLYMSHHQWLQPGEEGFPKPVDEAMPREEDGPKCLMLVATFDLGDLAFTNKVQNPEQADWDKEFGLMAAQMKNENLSDTEKRIADGENPYE